MTTPEPNDDPRESHLARLLAQYDDSLRSGSDAHFGESVPSDESIADAALSRRFRETRKYLQIIESVWPRQLSKNAASDFSAPLPAALHAAPRHLGRFEIRRVLGRGGVGIVYLARDSLLGRDVAIKVPRLEMVLTPNMRRRFLREAQTASLLNHPNIIPTLEVSEDVRGDEAVAVCFIVYPFCPGMTLAEWLRTSSEPPPSEAAARLVERLADAMAHAHQRGVLHRDLKPSNILLEVPEQTAPSTTQVAAVSRRLELPRITDFGLAKLVDSDDLTGTGHILGTPGYMAPEQTRNAKELGPACDIWALGVIFYELLTGQRPFLGDTPIDVMRAIQEGEPIPPRRLNSRTPRDLETICLKCLAKDPSRRYASAFDLAADLSRFQNGVPVLARPVSAAERLWKWCRKHPTAAALALLLLLVAGAATAGSWFYIARLEEIVESGRREQELEKREAEALQKNKILAGLAVAEEARSRRLQYVSDIRATFQAIRDHDRFASKALLERWPRATTDGAPDERGLEWYELKRQLESRPMKTLLAPLVAATHPNSADLEKAIRAFAMTPDCRFTATARNGDILIHDTKTGKMQATLAGPPAEKRFHLALTFSPDGKMLAAGYQRHDGAAHTAVALWDWRKPAPLANLGSRPLTDSMDLAFTHDGKSLMVRSGRTLSFHVIGDVAGKRVDFENGLVSKSALSPNESTLAVANESSKSIELWSLPSLRLIRAIPWDDAAQCEHLCFSPDDRFLAYATKRGCWIVDLQRFVPERVGPNWDEDTITALTFSNKAEWLHLFALPRTLFVYSMQNLNHVSTELSAPVMTHLTCDPNGRHLYARTRQGSVLSLDANWPVEPESIAINEGRLYALAFSPDSRRVAVAGHSSGIRVFDAQTLQPVDKFPWLGEVFSLAYSPQGTELVFGDIFGMIHRWQLSPRKALPPLKGHASRIGALAFLPDGERLLSMGWDKTCRVWRLPSGKMEDVVNGPYDHFSGIALKPGGAEFAWVGDPDPTIRIVSLSNKTEQILPSMNKGRAVAFSPDGSLLASSNASGELQLWDARTNKLLRHVYAHKKGVRSIAFSPDGKLIASAGLDHIVKIHDTATFLELLTLRGPFDELRALAWSPDGKTLAATGHDSQIWLWRGR